MKTQTSLVSRQSRLKEWAEMVRDCQNRTIGMSVGEWCECDGSRRGYMDSVRTISSRETLEDFEYYRSMCFAGDYSEIHGAQPYAGSAASVCVGGTIYK